MEEGSVGNFQKWVHHLHKFGFANVLRVKLSTEQVLCELGVCQKGGQGNKTVQGHTTQDIKHKRGDDVLGIGEASFFFLDAPIKAFIEDPQMAFSIHHVLLERSNFEMLP